uniref:WASH complex subunit 2D n=1 Tax=Myotis myotis TaxID=51298 RepID=A0A7J7RN62_MYOMY|nr:WASH complex subunit 2D [Myotis myotis]
MVSKLPSQKHKIFLRMIYLLQKQLNPYKKQKRRKGHLNPTCSMITLISLLT